MSEEFDYSEIENEARALLKDVEKRIKDCLKSTNKEKEKGMPSGMDWRSEALGYKTSLECIKRTREKFGLVDYVKPSSLTDSKDGGKND